MPDNGTDPLSLPYLLSAPETFYRFYPATGQSMVNIGGRKFLVIPRPQMDLDSPPPSPPPAAADRGGDRLPVLLQPADSSDDTPRLNPEPHISPQKKPCFPFAWLSIIKRNNGNNLVLDIHKVVAFAFYEYGGWIRVVALDYEGVFSHTAVRFVPFPSL